MFRRSRVGLLPMLLALALVVAACSSSDDTTTTTPTTTPEAAATTTTAAAATTTTEAVSTEPIKIAALTPLSSAGGPNFTPWGVQVNAGMQMAVDDINAAGGVDGRMLELIVADTQSNGVDGAAAFERVIEEGIVAAGGVISSDTGLATSRIAEEKSVPLFLVKAGSDAILTQDSRYTFRTCLPAAPMVAGPILQYAQSQGFTKVGAIIADYAWGQAMKSAMETAFATDDSIELQIEVAPVTESDFTTYLRSLEGFAPEMIVATGHPPGAGPITVQSADLGFDVPITGAYTPRALILGGVAEAGIGRYADFGCSDVTSTEYQDLARRFVSSTDNVFMEDDAVAGYGIVTMIAEAVGAVGDDGAAISEYLHANAFDLIGYTFTMEWTAWGELAQAQIAFDIMGPGPAPEGVNQAGDWYPERLILSEPLEPYVP